MAARPSRGAVRSDPHQMTPSRERRQPMPPVPDPDAIADRNHSEAARPRRREEIRGPASAMAVSDRHAIRNRRPPSAEVVSVSSGPRGGPRPPDQGRRSTATPRGLGRAMREGSRSAARRSPGPATPGGAFGWNPISVDPNHPVGKVVDVTAVMDRHPRQGSCADCTW